MIDPPEVLPGTMEDYHASKAEWTLPELKEFLAEFDISAEEVLLEALDEEINPVNVARFLDGTLH